VDEQPTVWFNPSCSKCRGTRELLGQRGVEASYVEYLEDAPTRAELERVLGLLGTDDPLSITRTGEARFAELGLAGADRDALLDALAANPILIERPIVMLGNRAVVARPPEKVLDLFT
jgi:arsenate reductase (glutaredoxin)